jgi:hypothetical protein
MQRKQRRALTGVLTPSALITYAALRAVATTTSPPLESSLGDQRTETARCTRNKPHPFHFHP